MTLPARLDPRHKSLARANLIVFLSLIAAIFLSDFPRNRATLWLILPTLCILAGTADTVRCIRKRWSFYHAGVIFCIYMDLMADSMVLFFLLYPYSHILSASG